MAQVKYVAAGFKTDVEFLLSDFIQSNSLDFPVFAELWKAKNFSLVYMGRSSESELTAFTQEIFYLSARYLTTETSVNARVGALYLLYALFRNQILDPPLRIRMVKEQFEVLASIRKALDLKTLRYVIDYLCEYGIDWVACPHVMGLMVHGHHDKPFRRNPNDLGPDTMVGLKTNLTDLADCKVLQNLSDLSAEYVKVKSSITRVAVDAGFTAHRRLGEFTQRLRNLLDDTIEVSGRSRRPRSCKKIGAIRTRLKQRAMGQHVSDGSDRDVSWVPKLTSKQKRRAHKKVKKPAEGELQSKAEVLGRFNKRKKPKSFKYEGNYWAPSNDSETLSKDAAEISLWYKNANVSDKDGSESEDVDSPKPVESADEVEIKSD